MSSRFHSGSGVGGGGVGSTDVGSGVVVLSSACIVSSTETANAVAVALRAVDVARIAAFSVAIAFGVAVPSSSLAHANAATGSRSAKIKAMRLDRFN